MLHRLTIDQAKSMDYVDLVRAAHAMIDEYAVPEDSGEPETEQERLTRLDRTLDELPDVYGWLLQLESFFDHWTDAYKDQFGQNHFEYKSMRQRRDAMGRAASAAKLRYQGASRVISKILGFAEEADLPRGR